MNEFEFTTNDLLWLFDTVILSDFAKVALRTFSERCVARAAFVREHPEVDLAITQDFLERFERFAKMTQALVNRSEKLVSFYELPTPYSNDDFVRFMASLPDAEMYDESSPAAIVSKKAE